jgi:hypothetical protein
MQFFDLDDDERVILETAKRLAPHGDVTDGRGAMSLGSRCVLH